MFQNTDPNVYGFTFFVFVTVLIVVSSTLFSTNKCHRYSKQTSVAGNWCSREQINKPYLMHFCVSQKKHLNLFAVFSGNWTLVQCLMSSRLPSTDVRQLSCTNVGIKPTICLRALVCTLIFAWCTTCYSTLWSLLFTRHISSPVESIALGKLCLFWTNSKTLKM